MTDPQSKPTPTPAPLSPLSPEEAKRARLRLFARSQPRDIVELLDAGAAYDLSNANDRERLADAFTRAAAFGDLKSAERLLQAGADVNAPAPRTSARTALIYALESGDEEQARLTAQWLLARGADPSLASSDKEAPLAIAAVHDRVAIVELLIQAGADLEARDRAGQTALHRAARCQSPQSVSALLRLGADPLALSAQGQPPMAEADTDEIKAMLRAATEAWELRESSAPALSKSAPRL